MLREMRQSSPTADLVAAGILLRRREARAWRWLLLKARKHGEWGFPKGHQEPGEGLLQTALRECAEECGIALLAVDSDPIELHYQVPDGRRKTAVYFPARTASSRFALSREHTEAAWFGAEEVQRRLRHGNLRNLFLAHLRCLSRAGARP